MTRKKRSFVRDWVVSEVYRDNIAVYTGTFNNSSFCLWFGTKKIIHVFGHVDCGFSLAGVEADSLLLLLIQECISACVCVLIGVYRAM